MNTCQSSDHMIVLWTPGSCIGLIRQELVGCCVRQILQILLKGAEIELWKPRPLSLGMLHPISVLGHGLPSIKSKSDTTRRMADKHENCFTEGYHEFGLLSSDKEGEGQYFCHTC